MTRCLSAWLALFLPVTSVWAATNQAVAGSQARGRSGFTERGVYKRRITPHWFRNNTRFWYRNDLRGSSKEFILVNAERGTRQSAFDHQKLALALSKAAGQEFNADQLPFSEIEFRGEDDSIRFEVAGKAWQCDLKKYECTASEGADSSAQSDGQQARAQADDQNRNQIRDQRRRYGSGGPGALRRAPDQKWSAFIKNHNVWVRSETDAKEFQLSDDGVETNAYGRLEWSPDSKALVGWRIEPGDRKEVYLVQSSPPGGGRAILKSRPYAQAGDKFTTFELSVFNIADQKQLKPAVDRFEHGWESPVLHWNRDGQHFAYMQVDRGHQRLRVIEVAAVSGAVRNLIDEKSQTFIWTAHTESLRLEYVNWLEKSDEMIYVSERDGWRHLYLVDLKEGKIRNQITKGEYVVRGIDRIDEEARQVWFTAGGKNPDQDPYFLHNYRVNFDGSGLVALTAANGNHSVQYSPDRKYLIDTYSRVDMPPKHELRRVEDATLVCPLKKPTSRRRRPRVGNLLRCLSPRAAMARRIFGVSFAAQKILTPAKNIR